MTINQKLKFINARKRHGDMLVLADISGYTQSHISFVLAGKRNNEDIVDLAYKFVLRRKTNVELGIPARKKSKKTVAGSK
jgi:hypothetical protein